MSTAASETQEGYSQYFSVGGDRKRSRSLPRLGRRWAQMSKSPFPRVDDRPVLCATKALILQGAHLTSGDQHSTPGGIVDARKVCGSASVPLPQRLSAEIRCTNERFTSEDSLQRHKNGDSEVQDNAYPSCVCHDWDIPAHLRYRFINGDEGIYVLASRLVFEHKSALSRLRCIFRTPLLPYVYGLWMREPLALSWVSARTCCPGC